MDNSFSPDVIASMKPLEAFGFSEATYFETRPLIFSFFAENAYVRLSFNSDYGDFYLLASFTEESLSSIMLGKVAPLSIAIKQDADVLALERRLIRSSEMSSYVTTYVRAMIKHASDILTGDFTRVRELQLEHYRPVLKRADGNVVRSNIPKYILDQL